MNFPRDDMYNLKDNHACLIRNLLHNERLQYEYADIKALDAQWIRTVNEAIDRMEHPDRYIITETEPSSDV